MSLTYLSFRNFFIAIQKKLSNLQIDGASILRIFFRYVAYVKPAVATVGVPSFISSWNDYIWPLVVLTILQKNFPVQVAITTKWPQLNQFILIKVAVLTDSYNSTYYSSIYNKNMCVCVFKV